jgi:hypothetical protein
MLNIEPRSVQLRARLNGVSAECKLRFTGVGFREDQLTAIEAGLTAMSEPDARIAIVDNFVDTVQRLTQNTAYSTGRGAGIVAAKLIHTPKGDVIVFNAPELRNRDNLLLERLAAH